MKKRAQVTIFVIIAIVIVAGIVGFFIIRDKIPEVEYVDPEVRPVYDFVVDCIEETGERALERIGQQGGYFLISDNFAVNDRIPYYFYEGQSYMPSKEGIEREISGLINEELGFCILGFKEFSDFEINHTNFLTNVEIKNESVIINVNYPLTIIKEEKRYQLENFNNIEFQLRLGLIYDMAEEVTLDQLIDPTSICLSCIYSMGNKVNLQVDMLDYGADTTIFTIIEENSTINNEPYKFSFAIQYE